MSTTTSTTTSTPPPLPFSGITLSTICSYLWRPYLLTGLYVDLLQQHFSRQDRIENPDLHEVLWRPDNRNAILIESYYSWTPGQGRLRPSVVAKRNTWAAYRRGIGDNRIQGRTVNSLGESAYSLLWVGSHTLFCIGQSGLQAEILGSEVQRTITEFGPAIRKSTRLMRIEVLQVGECFILEEGQQNFVVPITVGAAFEENWFLGKQAPRINKLRFELLCGYA